MQETALPARRRIEMVRFIRDQGQATVAELAAGFSVSVDTVRRDLEYLAEHKLVARTHGGAVPVGDLATADTPFLSRMAVQRDAKELIGHAAAEFVSDHETVLVNGGTTALAVVRALAGRRDLTLVTNNLRVPTDAPAEAVRDIYILGGTCRPASMVTIGPLAFPGTQGISVDVAIIGVGGVSATGLSTTNLAEAQLIRQMIDSAARTVVVADSSKFGRNAFVHICPLSSASVLVTDAPPAPELAEALAAAQVDVVHPEDDAARP